MGSPKYELTIAQQTRIIELEKRLFSYREIAGQVGVEWTIVREFLQGLQADTYSRFTTDRQVETINQLRCLEEVRKEAWLAWERSKGPLIRVTTMKGDAGGKPTSSKSKVRENQDGDPRFLEIIGKSLAQSAKLLGLEQTTERHSEIVKAAKEIASQRDRLRRLGHTEFFE